MANLKTKIEKHANDNEKRRNSIKEKGKAKLIQSKIIKQALLSTSLLNNSSRKITFSDEDDEFNDNYGGEKKENNKPALFDNSESSESEDFEINERVQFSGKKGLELLNLQSTFGNDERFKIDERFLEDENETLDVDKNEIPNSESNIVTEKTKHLKILENILGEPFKPEKEKKLQSRVHEMVRYDASNKDHKIYEIEAQTNTLKPLLKKKKVGKRPSKTDTEDLNKPKISKEKFYAISSEVKNQLKNTNNGQFSILETYGVNDNLNNESSGQRDIIHEMENNSECTSNEIMNGDDHKINSDYVEYKRKINEVEQQSNDKGFVAKGIWKESFFFDRGDNRFKEALDFINKKNSVEATEAAENYEKMRKRLKEILRLHLKKHMLKKDPFKYKIGGMNKKQITNFRFKNSKMIFKKKNLQKVGK